MPRIALAVGAIALFFAAAGAGIGVFVYESTHHSPPAAISVGNTCILRTDIPKVPTLWVEVKGGPALCGQVINVLKGYVGKDSKVSLVQNAPNGLVTVTTRGGIVIKALPGTVSPDLANQIRLGLASTGQ